DIDVNEDVEKAATEDANAEEEDTVDEDGTREVLKVDVAPFKASQDVKAETRPQRGDGETWRGNRRSTHSTKEDGE
ncbi:unnamed protein product, partial [Parnassius apollo]